MSVERAYTMPPPILERRGGGDRRWKLHEHHRVELRLSELAHLRRLLVTSKDDHRKQIERLVAGPSTEARMNALDRHRLGLQEDLRVLATIERAYEDAEATERRAAELLANRKGDHDGQGPRPVH